MGTNWDESHQRLVALVVAFACEKLIWSFKTQKRLIDENQISICGPY
jgi:hypothetical protein